MKNKVLYAIMSLLILTGCGSMKNMSREDRAGVGAQICLLYTSDAADEL